MLTTAVVFNEVDDNNCQVSLNDMFGNRKAMMFDHGAQELRSGFYSWKAGDLIQDALHFLTNEEREFFMTGVLPSEWDDIMGDDDQEEV